MLRISVENKALHMVSQLLLGHSPLLNGFLFLLLLFPRGHSRRPFCGRLLSVEQAPLKPETRARSRQRYSWKKDKESSALLVLYNNCAQIFKHSRATWDQLLSKRRRLNLTQAQGEDKDAHERRTKNIILFWHCITIEHIFLDFKHSIAFFVLIFFTEGAA